jgi:hypothetical protein
MKQITMDYDLYRKELAEAAWDGEAKARQELFKIMEVRKQDIEEQRFRMTDYPHETLVKIFEHFCPED